MEEAFSSLISILKHNPELFRKVFDSVPAGISITTDITCRDIRHNKKAAEFLRIQPWEVLSHTVSSDLPLKMFYKGKELSPEEMPIQRAVWQGESVKEQEIDLFWEDGKRKTAIWSSNPLLDENGSIIGAVAAFEDITERKELINLLNEHQEHLEELIRKRTWEVELSNYQLKKENFRRIEAEEELRKKNEEISSILESVTDSFFALDSEWKFTYANEEAKKYFSNKDVLGKNIWSLIPDAMGSIFWDNYHKVMSDREPIHFEAETIYSNIWVAVHVYPFQNGISVIFQDISEKKITEDNLRLSEEKFSNAFYKSPDMMVISSLDGRLIEANDRFLETFEYSRDEVLGHIPTESETWSIPVDRELIIDNLSKTGSVKNLETRYVTKTGKTGYLLSSIDLIEIAGEKCLIATMTDITEKKEMEKTLKAEEERWLITFMSCGDGIITTNVEGRVEKMNRVAQILTGWQQEEAKGKPLGEVFYIINELTRERCENPVEKVLATGKVIGLANHTALIGKDGTERVLADSAAPICDSEGNIHGVVLVFQDITEKVKKEKELEIAHRQIENILESVSDAFYALDSEWKLIYINEEVKRYLPVSEDIIGKNIFDIIPESVGSVFGSNYQKVMTDRKPVYFEAKMIYTGIWVGVSIYPFQDGISILFRDISERKQLEKELKEEEERLRITLRSIGDGVITTDIEGRVDMMNRAAETLTGWQQEEAKGKPLGEVFYIINEQTRQRCENPVEKVLETGKVIGLANSTVLVSRDGEERVLTDSAAPIDDCEGNIYGVILVFQDITKRVKMEKDMARLDRLDLIGQMAGGIAHEIRNPMTSVRGYLQYLGEKKEFKEYSDRFGIMIGELDRANSIITEYLTLARSKAYDAKPGNLNEIIKSLIPFTSVA